jgi:hypothetical protein
MLVFTVTPSLILKKEKQAESCCPHFNIMKMSTSLWSFLCLGAGSKTGELEFLHFLF